MNTFLQLIGEVLLSGCGPKKDGTGTRVFVIFTMTLAGISFLVFAGFVIVRAGWRGMPLGVILVGLSAVAFWLASRGRRS